MENLQSSEYVKVSGGYISFGESIALGSFAGGAGAAAAGAGITAIAGASVGGGLIVGAGFAGYAFGNAIGLNRFGARLGSRLYDRLHKQR